MNFVSPRLGNISKDELIDQVVNFVLEEKTADYKLVIGTDSHIYKNNDGEECDYVSAIVIHRIGVGARYFWAKETIKRAPQLREKIYTETTKSLSLATEIIPIIREKLEGVNCEMEIHVDIGPNGPTRELIREIVGMVVGSGFRVKTKPESWAASSVADKHT